MKTKTLFLFLLMSSFAFSQNSGRGFSYQALARNAKGDVLFNQKIELRFSFMPGKTATPATWVETDTVTTDKYGTFSVVIGGSLGTKVSGTVDGYKDIDFGIADYWLKVEINDGGFKEVSYSQMLGTPYTEYAVMAGNGVPVGTIEAFASSVIPKGWLLCNGSEISRTDYKKLFDVIGIVWGVGNSNNTFNLPDLRAASLRGVGTSTKFVSNSTVGLGQIINDSIQGFQVGGVSTGSNFYGYISTVNSSLSITGAGGYGNIQYDIWSQGGGSMITAFNDGKNGNPRKGKETTGKAFGVNYIIKY